MTPFVFVLVVLVAVSAAPNLSISESRDAKLGEFPYLISLQVKRDFGVQTQHSCGGTLIRKQWVLTSAKCVDRKSKSSRIVAIYGGFVDQSTTKKLTQYTPQTIYIFPDYKPGLYYLPAYHDIALVKLDRPVEVDENFNIATLPAEDSVPDFTKEFTLVGWGIIIDGDNYTTQSILQAKNFAYLDYDECYQKVSGYVGGNTDQFALNPEKYLCTGPKDATKKLISKPDRGSPLIQNGVVQAVQSYALDYRVDLTIEVVPSGIFTKVAPYVKWIESIIGNQ